MSNLSLKKGRAPLTCKIRYNGVMKAIDNETGHEVYLVATNATNQTLPNSLQDVLTDNEIYIGGKEGMLNKQ
ncbi:MAG: hypothetical protein K2M60_01370 [Lachnospiraceae bacterium]|nr:hypothetical protein [Lachnospiraceae bacterium]